MAVKMDARKTWEPVSNHPTPTTETPDEALINEEVEPQPTDLITHALLKLATEICKSSANLPLMDASAGKAVWCMRELMMFISHDVDTIFSDLAFKHYADSFPTHSTSQGGGWMNDPTTICHRGIDLGSQTPPLPSTSEELDKLQEALTPLLRLHEDFDKLQETEETHPALLQVWEDA